MGFGTTKEKSKKQTKLKNKPQKDTKIAANVGNDTIRKISSFPAAKMNTNASKNEIIEIDNPNSETNLQNLNIKTTNKNFKKGEYYDLGKSTIKIFYKHTHGMDRANPEQWENIHREYIYKTQSKISLSTFKVYLWKTKEIHLKNRKSSNESLFRENNHLKNDLNQVQDIEAIKNNVNLDKELLKITDCKSDKNSSWSSENSNNLKYKEICKNLKDNTTNLIKDNILINENSKSNLLDILIEKCQKNRINGYHKDNETKINKKPEFKYRKVLSPQEILEIHKSFTNILHQIVTDDNYRTIKCFKIPNDKLDWSIINQINNEIKICIEKYETPNYQNIVDLLTTAQITYQSLTKKKKQNKKNSKEVILAKIEILNEKLKYLASIRDYFQYLNKNEMHFKDIVAKFGKINTLDDLNAVEHKINNIVFVLAKKVKRDDEYKEVKRINYQFELHRKAFYKNLDEIEEKQHKNKPDLDTTEISKFWRNIWEKIPNKNKNYDGPLDLFRIESVKIKASETTPITDDEFKKLIDDLQLWKSPGSDVIYSFWIKYMTSLHKHILITFQNFLRNTEDIPEYFFHGRTIFIPKDDGSSIDKLRPITCQSNIYKIFTKLLKNRLLGHILSNDIISINQAGSIPHIHASKEQFLINKAITKKSDKYLNVAYIDVKKAFDTVDRVFLKKFLKSLKHHQKF
ncbi:LINE-1 retrotransposable element ORF2 protein [Dictyocoela muelleri]|nr:LINE-1 retrotransposable element ORF2 protein [Dictyocoela muelleri]